MKIRSSKLVNIIKVVKRPLKSAVMIKRDSKRRKRKRRKRRSSRILKRNKGVLCKKGEIVKRVGRCHKKRKKYVEKDEIVRSVSESEKIKSHDKRKE
jgi:hypothetical protein